MLVGRSLWGVGLLIALGVGSLALLVDLVRHRRAARRLTPAVRFRPALGVVPSFGWLFLALAAAVTPLFWFAPVLIAGGALRRHARRSMPPVLAETGRRLRATSHGPLLPQADGRTCRRPRCNTPIPDAAGFCPRCGKAA